MGEIVLGEVEMAALERFRLSTVFTLGTERTRHLYAERAVKLGFKVRLVQLQREYRGLT